MVLWHLLLFAITISAEKSAEERTIDCFEDATKDYLPPRSPREHHTHFHSHGARDTHVLIEGVIDEIDEEHLFALASCIKTENPAFFDNRNGGGNNITYLGAYVTNLLPDLTDQLVDIAAVAAEEAGWRPHPRHLGIRCIELLEYIPGGELKMELERDSIYTMVVMLSEPHSFIGGPLILESRVKHDYREVRMAHHGAVIFDSMVPHGVAPISSGKRIVLALEFWAYAGIGPTDRRPDPEDRPLKKPWLIATKVVSADEAGFAEQDL